MLSVSHIDIVRGGNVMKKYLNWIKKNIFNEKEDDNKSEEKYREVTEKDTTHANNEDEISISHMDDLFWNAEKIYY